jgi:hypothetical protein
MAASQFVESGGVSGHQAEAAKAEHDVKKIKHGMLRVSDARNMGRPLSSLDWEIRPAT